MDCDMRLNNDDSSARSSSLRLEFQMVTYRRGHSTRVSASAAIIASAGLRSPRQASAVTMATAFYYAVPGQALRAY
jgi:hypothetical protein